MDQSTEYDASDKIQWFKENLFGDSFPDDKYKIRLNDCINDRNFRVIVNLNDIRALNPTMAARSLYTIIIIIIILLF
jgi:hypothetical protein